MTSNKSSKVKRVLLDEFSTSAGPKSKPLKGRGSKFTPKQKRTSDDKFVGSGATKVKSGRKKQPAPHQDSKDKAAKAKKQTTTGKKDRKKVSMKVADNSPIGHGLSSTLTSVNFPDISDEGPTEPVTGDAGSPVRAECGDSKEEEREDRQELQKTTTFTWYQIHVLTLMSLGVVSCDVECVFDFHCQLRLCTLVYRVLIHNMYLRNMIFWPIDYLIHVNYTLDFTAHTIISS
jgi:hypothetical protein